MPRHYLLDEYRLNRSMYASNEAYFQQNLKLFIRTLAITYQVLFATLYNRLYSAFFPAFNN
jgi:hypothetical protein